LLQRDAPNLPIVGSMRFSTPITGGEKLRETFQVLRAKPPGRVQHVYGHRAGSPRFQPRMDYRGILWNRWRQIV